MCNPHLCEHIRLHAVKECISAFICLQGRIDIIRMFLHHGADILGRQRYTDSLSLQPIHFACGALASNVNLEVVQLLVEHGADVNAYDTEGHQPLHLACKSNHLNVVQFLLSLGVDVNSPGPQGKTALQVACFDINDRISPKIVQFLLEHGADVHASVDNGLDCMSSACIKLSLEKVLILLAYGAKVKTLSPRLFCTVFEKVRPDIDQIPELFTVLELLLAAGATLDCGFVASSLEFVLQANSAFCVLKDKVLNFLWQYLAEPPRLKNLCRVVVRDNLLPNIDTNIKYLGLPEILQDYLRFENVIPGRQFSQIT